MTPPPRVLVLPGGEPILHHGPLAGPQLLVLQPLFEETNRCRALVRTLAMALAGYGYGAWLPDLPGCGESARALETVGWDEWTETVGAAVALIVAETGAPPATIALRGGTLLDGAGARRWRLSPVTGASLVTDLRRAGLLARGAYPMRPALHDPLVDARATGDARVIRLTGDERPCDRRIDGPPLWRRPEPANDERLAAALADDIHAWLAP